MNDLMKNTSTVSTSEKEFAIIDAARKRFAHFGFSKVTMDEIASDVEMGKASLYYYFPTKESLFEKVIKQEQDELASAIEVIINSNKSPVKMLSEYVELRLDFFQRLVNLGTLHVHSVTDSKSIYGKLFKEFEQKELKYIQKIFQKGIEKGIFRKDLLKDFPLVFIHILQGLRFRVLKQYRIIDKQENLINDLRKEMKITVDITLNGIKNRSKYRSNNGRK